jgi:hypothetical protein
MTVRLGAWKLETSPLVAEAKIETSTSYLPWSGGYHMKTWTHTMKRKKALVTSGNTFLLPFLYLFCPFFPPGVLRVFGNERSTNI